MIPKEFYVILKYLNERFNEIVMTFFEILQIGVK